MQKNIIIVGVIALIIGSVVGYGVGKRCMYKTGHMMKDMSMEHTMSSMNANLEGKMGDEFDKVFIKEMIVHHQGAVEMANLALTNTKHEEIKKLANDIISAQNKEIDQMKSWLDAWYK